MIDTPDSSHTALGDILAEALDRAVGTSLESIFVLRQAVRNYTRNQKARGVSLDQVMMSLSAILMDAEDERPAEATVKPRRDPELARQLRAWCSLDYSLDGSEIA